MDTKERSKTNQDIEMIELDDNGSALTFDCLSGEIELYDAKADVTARSRYCYVHEADEHDASCVIEIGSVTVSIDSNTSFSLSNTDFANYWSHPFDGFYLSALNRTAMAPDIRDEYYCYPSADNGSDVTFCMPFELKEAGEHSEEEDELLVVTTHKSTATYKADQSFAYKFSRTVPSASSDLSEETLVTYGVGYINSYTEISESLYDALKSSNRSFDVSESKVNTLTSVESFRFSRSPEELFHQENLKSNAAQNEEALVNSNWSVP